MRLLNCRIDAFGKLRGVQFDFKEGLNSFCFENGWGKTTLASFIRAMFYGLKSERANSKDAGERAHFRPFDGNAFGGSLQFVYGGDTYTVKRAFDARSEARDRAEFFCNGREIYVPDGDFGKNILGIDEQSFSRTLFAGHEDIETTSTGDINARLNAYSRGEGSAELAVKRLDAERKKYKKDRGNSGIINTLNAGCDRIRADISAARQRADKLDGLYAEREELTKKSLAVQAELDRAGQNEQAKARRNTYRQYSEDAERERAAATAIARTYPNGLPSAGETERARQTAADARARRQTYAEDAEKMRLQLESRFADMPESGEIEACRRAANSFYGLKNVDGEAERNSRARRSRLTAALLCASLGLMGAGIASFIYNVPLAGAVATVLALLLAVLCAVQIRSFKVGADGEAEKRARRIYSRYGYDSAQSFVRDIDELERLKAQGSKAVDESAPLQAFLGQYAPHLEGDDEEKLRRICADSAAYEEHIKMASRLEARAKEFFDGDAPCSAPDTRELVRRLSSLNAAMSSLDARIEECEAYAQKMPDLENALKAELARVESAEDDYRILVAAIRHIENADRELKERVVSPIENAYRAYASRINRALGEGAAIDAELGVMYEDGGALRGGLHMSSGQAAASSLCFRLALCDCLYGSEKPFIVLDDPFAYLDENCLANCAAVLRELARGRQIIYFACHPSRRI